MSDTARKPLPKPFEAATEVETGPKMDSQSHGASTAFSTTALSPIGAMDPERLPGKREAMNAAAMRPAGRMYATGRARQDGQMYADEVQQTAATERKMQRAADEYARRFGGVGGRGASMNGTGRTPSDVWQSFFAPRMGGMPAAHPGATTAAPAAMAPSAPVPALPTQGRFAPTPVGQGTVSGIPVAGAQIRVLKSPYGQGHARLPHPAAI